MQHWSEQRFPTVGVRDSDRDEGRPDQHARHVVELVEQASDTWIVGCRTDPVVRAARPPMQLRSREADRTRARRRLWQHRAVEGLTQVGRDRDLRRLRRRYRYAFALDPQAEPAFVVSPHERDARLELAPPLRSEERRVGKAWRSRWRPR